MSTEPADRPRLDRLLSLLERDPANTHLLLEAASVAYEERAFDRFAQLLTRYETIRPLPPELQNLKGLVAISEGRFSDALAVFLKLLEHDLNNPALKMNLAWSYAMTGDWSQTLDLLDDGVLASSVRAPVLKIQAFHHLELYDEALECGAELMKRFPDNAELAGALATVAFDADNLGLARTYAAAAGNSAEGFAAQGLLALGDESTRQSTELFEKALARQPQNARAWVGKGLALLSSGDAKAGAAALDRGAELFGDHIGSWVASGWAHFVEGDLSTARARFERAYHIDPNFSESHGGLAVLDTFAGNIDAAQRQCEIALRLDRKCFGAALAKSLLLEMEGKNSQATRVREMALSAPIGIEGQTIAQLLLRLTRKP